MINLKQTRRQWYKQFDAFMFRHGYSQSDYDNCVYHRRLTDSSFVYLLLYVDDILIVAKNMFELKS